MKKRENREHKIKQGDIILIACLCAVCLAWFIIPLVKSSSPVAVVTLDGKTVREIRLDEVTDDFDFEVGGCVLRVSNGSIRFFESDCRDRLCIKCGSLSKNSDTAACVPNRVAVVVRNDKNKQYDMVAY